MKSLLEQARELRAKLGPTRLGERFMGFDYGGSGFSGVCEPQDLRNFLDGVIPFLETQQQYFEEFRKPRSDWTPIHQAPTATLTPTGQQERAHTLAIMAAVIWSNNGDSSERACIDAEALLAQVEERQR